MPHLPSSLQLPVQEALEKDRLRRMPNSFFPSREQGGHQTKEGVILLGDAWNMRHPLTGGKQLFLPCRIYPYTGFAPRLGGMTVAFNDVVILTELLCSVENLNDWDQISRVLHRWHWSRKPLAATINILSVALYDLFGAEGLFCTSFPLSK